MKTVKQNGKDISMCFMNKDTYSEQCNGKTEEQMVQLAEDIYTSTLEVLDASNKTYGTLSRQEQIASGLILKKIQEKKEKINNTIECLNLAIDTLENGEQKEFSWIAYMINNCLGKGEEED